MQREIDGMEHQARELRIDDAGDGRVGVEDPCKLSHSTIYLVLR